MKSLIASLLLFFSFILPDPIQKVRQYRQAHEQELLKEYEQFLSIPNVVTDTVNIRKNADFLVEIMQQRGIKTQLLTAKTAGAPPVVFGEVTTPGATQTIIFYAHYDGQPVVPSQWKKPPFEPTYASNSFEKGGSFQPRPTGSVNPEWRLYARASADDKAGVISILNAYKALVEAKVKPTVNLKFIFEGEEESGSRHLGEVLQKYTDLLKADLWLINDGPVHLTGRKQISFGVRGGSSMELTVYGTKTPLHSGHYGNWAPDPSFTLASLLATMKDSTGRVTIDGFYDDIVPLSALEKEALAKIPNVDTKIQKEVGLARPDGNGKTIDELNTVTSFNILGMQSGNIGKQAANAIPASATALISMRLVLGNDADRQREKVIRHIRKQGFYVTFKEPTDEERAKYPKIAKVTGNGGGNAHRTRMDLPIAQQVIKAVQATSQEPIVLLPTYGAGMPLNLISTQMKTENIIIVPIVNPDNNQHAANENLRLQNLWDGIESMAAIMTMK
ncbi:MAG: M20/M25/M40 family metallo-hydrolase [Siphonobacter sp.]